MKKAIVIEHVSAEVEYVFPSSSFVRFNNFNIILELVTLEINQLSLFGLPIKEIARRLRDKSTA
jgi:hypothetical protein